MSNFVRRIRHRLAASIAPTQASSGDTTVNDLPRIFFCHVPKCAGTSVVSAIWQQVYAKSGAAKFDVQLAPSKRAAEVCDVPVTRARELALVYHLSNPTYSFGFGHVRCRPSVVDAFHGEWDFVTILRNPVDRWISEFVFNTYKRHDWAKNELPLEEYFDSREGIISGQTLVRFFSNIPVDTNADPSRHIEEAIDNLSRFRVVGTVANLQDWCVEMKRAFRANLDLAQSNVSPKQRAAIQIRSDAKVMKRIEELCQHDMEIYRRHVEEYVESRGNRLN